MHAAGTMLATSAIVLGMGLGMALVPGSAMRVAMADDDVVAGAGVGVAAVAEAGDEPPPEADGKHRGVLFAKDGPVARHLQLGWDGKRLAMEAERLPELQDFVNKHEKRVAAAVAKQAIDAAIKKGLSRQRAEEIFGDLMRGVLAPAAQGQQGGGFGFARRQRFRHAQVAADDDDQAPERVSPLEALYGAAQAAAFEVGGGGSSGSSGRGGASVSSHFQSGSIRGQLDSSPTSAELQFSGPGHKLIVTRDGDTTLTIRVETEGAEGDAPDQLLRIRQTEKAFRATLVRDGENVGAAEGETFADAYRGAPAFVREKLAPALEAIGISLPPLPESAAVRAAVLAELRAVAGRPATAAEQAPAGEPAAKVGDSAVEQAAVAEWRQAVRAHRERRFAATIEAFRLTEDADYLKSLLDGAPADDAAVIRSRLDKLATGK
jgi:hypothetical protein